ncbi:MAG: hypothetical protein LVS60_03330 [Nodosilinea sp. LVE1205-7]|jgi:hypothetical protein
MIVREPLEIAYQHYQAQQEQIQDEKAEAWALDLAYLQEMVDRWGLLTVVGALFRDFEAGLGRRQVAPLSEVNSDEF